MPRKIHISTARAMLNAREPVDIGLWKADGSVQYYNDCVSLRYDYYGGWRNVKLLSSGQIRRVRDICIFSVNGLEVFI